MRWRFDADRSGSNLEIDFESRCNIGPVRSLDAILNIQMKVRRVPACTDDLKTIFKMIDPSFPSPSFLKSTLTSLVSIKPSRMSDSVMYSPPQSLWPLDRCKREFSDEPLHYSRSSLKTAHCFSTFLC
jgi:hypothetical protein